MSLEGGKFQVPHPLYDTLMMLLKTKIFFIRVLASRVEKIRSYLISFSVYLENHRGNERLPVMGSGKRSVHTHVPFD